MKKVVMIALGASLALGLSGLSVAQASNPFQNNTISSHTQNTDYKNCKKMKDGKYSTCKCKKDCKCPKKKSKKKS